MTNTNTNTPNNTEAAERPRNISDGQKFKNGGEIDIATLRARCPFPVLLKQLGLGKHAKPSCCSPLRREKTASWGIFQRNGRWYWKDHGTDEGGDEIEFLAKLKELDPHKDFTTILALWATAASKCPETPVPTLLPPVGPAAKPNRSGFGRGTDDQIERLGKLRGIEVQGLQIARERGQLVFGRFAGFEVYGVTDSSGNVLEARRLDGTVFPAHGEGLAERKSHAVKGSRKSWPVGIADVDARPMILLTEGVPDFLAAFEVIVTEGALDRVAPVSMLSAASRIAADALPLFKGKHVRIVPHCDEPGRKAAVCWSEQLVEAGARKVDFLRLNNGQDEGSPIKDLNDFLPLYRREITADPVEGSLL